MKLLFVGMIAVALATTACSKGTEGVAADGTCTQATIDSFNDINNKAKLYDITQNKSYLIEISNQCVRFNNLIGGDSCKAIDEGTKAEKSVTRADADRVCGIANKILASNKKPIPAPAAKSPCYAKLEETQVKIDSLKKQYEESNKKEDLLEVAAECAAYKESKKETSCKGAEFNEEILLAVTRTMINSSCETVQEKMSSKKKSPSKKVKNPKR